MHKQLKMYLRRIIEETYGEMAFISTIITTVQHMKYWVYEGKCSVQLGGHNGIETEIEKGDVIIIPAGVAHINKWYSENFACVGG